MPSPRTVNTIRLTDGEPELLGDEGRDVLAEYLPDDEYGGDRRPVVFYY